MSDEHTETTRLLRLRVSAEADAGLLARLIGHFQNLNIVPHRIVAEFATTDMMHIHIDVSGMTERRLTLLAAKVHQWVPVTNAHWHWL
jgi:hypothetical protein